MCPWDTNDSSSTPRDCSERFQILRSAEVCLHLQSSLLLVFPVGSLAPARGARTVLSLTHSRAPLAHSVCLTPGLWALVVLCLLLTGWLGSGTCSCLGSRAWVPGMGRAPISQLLPCQPECWPLGSAWSGWTPFLTFSVFGELRGSFTFPGSPALISVGRRRQIWARHSRGGLGWRLRGLCSPHRVLLLQCLLSQESATCQPGDKTQLWSTQEKLTESVHVSGSDL